MTNLDITWTSAAAQRDDWDLYTPPMSKPWLTADHYWRKRAIRNQVRAGLTQYDPRTHLEIQAWEFEHRDALRQQWSAALNARLVASLGFSGAFLYPPRPIGEA